MTMMEKIAKDLAFHLAKRIVLLDDEIEELNWELNEKFSLTGKVDKEISKKIKKLEKLVLKYKGTNEEERKQIEFYVKCINGMFNN